MNQKTDFSGVGDYFFYNIYFMALFFGLNGDKLSI